jgi:hypothetical protein
MLKLGGSHVVKILVHLLELKDELLFFSLSTLSTEQVAYKILSCSRLWLIWQTSPQA